jgi:hypothetical protein
LVAKVLLKLSIKAGAKSVAKKIPGLGFVYGLYDAITSE